MTSAESTNYAKRYLQKAVEYLASAQDNFDLERATPTEPRGVVGFEVILGALLAALDGGVVTSIHLVVEQRHGLL